MPTKIKVSAAAFNEFAAAMEKLGRKQGVNAGEITLEKDDTIVDPTDWRATTVRKDCLMAVAQIKNITSGTLIETLDKVYHYVITGTKE